ncbi:MAG TPA: PIN domain-containing protein [Chitinophagales bacterium]|nr:PIN domain-containing protein [Chitinophagales bacterium]
MSKYNLLPNDALILATCKLNQINMIASFDSDFKTACEKEKIQYIDSVKTFNSLNI